MNEKLESVFGISLYFETAKSPLNENLFYEYHAI